MVRKKVEGDEVQRRAAARAAREAGESPSARNATTGGSKQRTHVPGRNSLDHEERIEPLDRGKQWFEAAERAAERAEPPPAPPPGRSFTGRTDPGYGREHQAVFQAVAKAEQRHGGNAVYAHEVARTAGIPHDRAKVLLHDLVTSQRLVTKLERTDDPDLGPRYETRP
ncbi:hypothetical protein RM844_27815 [Streptomyces sp. DSM 44915]|uniref:Uncharacterized protein n=1 Tax=Streptomyces chisholmiae TaxID=3075540 RepID=A0ABU2JZA9_9ACTN|nr:hypothetical protein [Streptomyces sp. DSM 44915]MDT0270088.1 hypothetical protein [Streptomyces sp. DSM 44915]